MIFLSLEEFAVKRRKAQTDIEAALKPIIRDSIDHSKNTSGWDDLLSAVTRQYEAAYREDAGTSPRRGMPSRFREDLRETLRKTAGKTGLEDPQATTERIALWLATAILSRATIDAAADDPEELLIEWVDMHDKSVRPAHHDANGQQRPVGEKFTVGPAEMTGPGDPTAPIELWINCRCTLRPVLANEPVHASGDPLVRDVLAAMETHPDIRDAWKVAAAVSDKPWNGSASRFTPEQWKASCILHVCDGLEKSCHKLPIKEPGGALSRAGVHAAAGRIGSTNAPSEKIASAKRALRGAYRQLGESPPDSLTAGGTTVDDNETQAYGAIPWHGILAPEGKWSGDKRRFAEGSLSTRPLPLPLTWQKQSSDGHDGNVVVAKIEAAEVVDGEMRASGHFLVSPEADEFVGLLAQFGRFGVSVDADSVVFGVEDDEEGVTFAEARVSSACAVPIPAFAEAWVAIGEPPWGEMPDEMPDEALVASGYQFTEEMLEQFKRGPGWVTNPEGTARIHRYWTTPGEPGYEKIGWGTDGDYTRCLTELGEEIGENSPDKLRFMHQICAQWQHDAIGIWPGKGEKAAAETLEFTEPAESVTLTASTFVRAPAAWFEDPNLDKPTPLEITDEGRVFGHIAAWDTCHIGFPDTCTVAPHSASGYAYFLTGQVALDNGERVPVGPLTVGGGHASPRLGLRAAMAHYDSTSAAVCDVTVGEDEHGIWCAGWVRPGATDEQVTALLASPLSGDWRPVGNDMEMVAALAVNTPGFMIPRVQVAASNGRQLSLVAAGVVRREEHEDLPTFDIEAIAEAVARQMIEAQERREKMAALAARVNGAADAV